MTEISESDLIVALKRQGRAGDLYAQLQLVQDDR
jgi:hypothetical protein